MINSGIKNFRKINVQPLKKTVYKPRKLKNLTEFPTQITGTMISFVSIMHLFAPIRSNYEYEEHNGDLHPVSAIDQRAIDKTIHYAMMIGRDRSEDNGWEVVFVVKDKWLAKHSRRVVEDLVSTANGKEYMGMMGGEIQNYSFSKKKITNHGREEGKEEYVVRFYVNRKQIEYSSSSEEEEDEDDEMQDGN